jgi:hypothetical protein
MGINDLLPHLPGGERNKYLHSFYNLGYKNKIVPFDAASALWQFAAKHPNDYLRGNHDPALLEWARFLVYLRSICGWELVVFMDGMENEAKRHEAERRRIRMERAREQENPVGQITNTPEYITKAAHVCIFLRIKVRCARKEADPQVSYYAKLTKSIPVVGDSDELAYGLPEEVGILVIVKGFTHEWMKLLRK